MDMTSYAQAFLRVEDLTPGQPIKVTINHILNGKFDKPVLYFTDGSKLTLNKSNARTLTRAYGPNTDDWEGMVVELSVGEALFEGKLMASIIITPVSAAGQRTPVPPSAPFDDKIPF